MGKTKTNNNLIKIYDSDKSLKWKNKKRKKVRDK